MSQEHLVRHLFEVPLDAPSFPFRLAIHFLLEVLVFGHLRKDGLEERVREDASQLWLTCLLENFRDFFVVFTHALKFVQDSWVRPLVSSMIEVPER